MNTFISDPTAAGTMARQMIEERVRDAEQRRTAHTLRAQRRAERHAERAAKQQAGVRHTAWKAFRIPRLARRRRGLRGTATQSPSASVVVPPEALN